MEFYDTFDESGVFMSSEDEHDVHYKGLWHKVIRIWLYDNEGNIYLRVRAKDNKLDCITELHIQSTESVSSCFDRGMFEKLGIHLPATSEISQANQKKVKIHKVFSDNSELKDNYFLCDYIGEFDKSSTFFIFSSDTSGLVKVNAKGIGSLLSTRTGEVVGYEVKPNSTANKNGEKRFIKAEDIFATQNEDPYSKFGSVVTAITNLSLQSAKKKREAEKLEALAKKKKKVDEEEFVSHADENEGDEVY